MRFQLYKEDCFQWMRSQQEKSIHAIVTDPPYGLVEYSKKELDKMENGVGGIWRIPPKIGGTTRAPLPRFTVLSKDQVQDIQNYFFEFGKESLRLLVPGGHLFIASNPLLVSEVISGLKKSGFEQRGILVRLVRTLKGGYRPKLAEDEYDEVSSMPRSCWEPWALLRKPLEVNIRENLRKYGTGGLRREPNKNPFLDVILSERTPKREKVIAPHPTLKPQSLMRRLVWSSLPVGKGIILDPFCGAGSTIAAAESMGLDSIGVEINDKYYTMAKNAIPRLVKLEVPVWNGVNNEAYSRKMDSFLDIS